MKLVIRFAVTVVLAVSAIAESGSQASTLEYAKQLISENKCSEAIPILEQIAASDPTSAPEALQTMGGCCKKLGNWSKGIECFERLLEDYPNSAAPDREVRSWIMDCYLANNDADKALALRNELLSEYQQDAWKLYYILGRRYVWRQQYAKAIPELEKAVELGFSSMADPDMFDAKRRLLHCYVEEKKWAEAELLAELLAASHPDQAYEWDYELGRCYQGQRQYDKAIVSLESAMQFASANVGLVKNIRKTLLNCYDLIGEKDKAISMAEKLVEDYPQEPAWCYELGRRYVARGNYGEAVAFFEGVIELSSRRWEIRSAWQYLGECLFKLDRGNEAMQRLADYYKDKPGLWDEYLLAKGAALYYGASDDAGCIAALGELISQVDSGRESALAPTARELQYKALKRQGDLANAALVMEQMAAKSADLMRLLQAGEDYYHAGNYPEAQRLYQGVIDLANVPSEIRAGCMYGLALCYWDTGLKEAAKQLMKEVSEKYPETEAAAKARDLLTLWSQRN